MNLGGGTVQPVAHQLWRISEKIQGDSARIRAQSPFLSQLPGLWDDQRSAQRMEKVL